MTEAEQAAIEAHGLFDLKSFLPKKPGEVELKVIKEMFEASVDGEAFDMERWGQYFKPAGMSAATGDPVKSTPKASAPAPTPAQSDDYDDEPAPKAAPANTPAGIASHACGAFKTPNKAMIE